MAIEQPKGLTCKAEWRRWAKQQRQHLPVQALSRAICEQLVCLSVFQQASVIGAYWPLAGEIDWTPLAQAYPDKQWLLPRIISQEPATMAFHTWALGEPLASGILGVQEPAANRPVYSWPSHPIDLFFVPALAVDQRGNRLGYGKGFYDRFLAKRLNHQTLVLALSPESLRVDDLPVSSLDQPMDGIVTEQGLWIPESQ